MEPSTTQETDASPLTGVSHSTIGDLIGGSDALGDSYSEFDPLNKHSSNITALENSLIKEKSDISPSHSQPHLEKEIDVDSSKDTEISGISKIEAQNNYIEPTNSKPEEISEPVKEIKPEAELFGFNKPLPPEPFESTSDFLKSEATAVIKSTQDKDKDEDGSEFVGAASDSPVAISREDSPIPPPIPKHQNLRDESPDRFESSPEPDFKPMEPSKDDEEILKPRPVSPAKPVEVKEAPKKEEKTPSVGDIGAKDIIVEIDAWFNPARLHPQVESLVYWRDPKKSGAVFGVLMVTLLSLTCFSLISVVAYLSLLTLAGTISFRTYKSIMQAVQKTSDGHPFKEYLELDISLPEEKVSETARIAAQHINTAMSALRSLFLVEDLIDSIKGLVLFWTLTYVGAVFNGLTLLIIGVVLVFSLPRLYEKNKAQVDAYIQIGMDKLSIITSRMKAAIPSGKKDEKPKDQ
ncbi:reticulon-1 isoform X2 [Halyomorpha halys]|uniref:reticulon-1 isoform X2 n=1 Tax=Halyomorpha halys TaxID=286706 RepID=UPI0006D4CA62|nr:reticulon-1-like isoform X2 [Halyomorpha halys]